MNVLTVYIFACMLSLVSQAWQASDVADTCFNYIPCIETPAEPNSSAIRRMGIME